MQTNHRKWAAVKTHVSLAFALVALLFIVTPIVADRFAYSVLEPLATVLKGRPMITPEQLQEALRWLLARQKPDTNLDVARAMLETLVQQ